MYKNFLINLVDIAILSYICYRVIIIIKGTRVAQILLGFLVIGIVTALAMYLKLDATAWVLHNFWAAGVIIFIVVFQPDIRSSLAQLGSGKFTTLFMREGVTAVKELVSAVEECSFKKIGMLIVIERETGLRDIIEKGVKINGEVTEELLMSIFYPRSPLHDGAVIIGGSRILAAACVLPSTENPGVSKFFGMRHRAALGISEVSDAWAIVVSEETGVISIAHNGNLTRNVTLDDLEKLLINIWKKPENILTKKDVSCPIPERQTDAEI